ncbi:MAG: carbohydrate ABC transporter permease [Sphaerochaetaceae bacterium]
MKKEEALKATFATILGLILVFPIYYSLAASFFQVHQFFAYPPQLLPTSLSLVNYARALKESPLARFMFNSLYVSVVGSAIRMSVAILAAFATAYFTFKGRDFLFFLILGTMMLPSDALIIENYLMVRRLGLLDTYLGIMAVYLLAPVQMFMLRQAFKSIPYTFKEVAMMDGCSDFAFLTKIVLPITRPIVLTLSLHSFVTIWNTYLWPLLVTNNPQMRTVQVGITMLGYTENLDYGPIFAAISLVLIPSLILFLLLRRYIVEGIASGSIVG